ACVTKRFRRWGGAPLFELITNQKKPKQHPQQNKKKKHTPHPITQKKKKNPNQNQLLKQKKKTNK
ncbi:hypothetical protein, partial [Enterobacter mori]